MSLSPDRGSLAASQAEALSQSADWQSVLVHFDFHEGFAFGLLLVAGNPLARACRADLERHLALSGKRLLDLSPASPDDLLALCLSLPQQTVGPDVGGIWISAVVSEYQSDFREWEDSFRNAFARLNPIRNVLQHRLPCTLLFVGAPWVQSVIRSTAPDLWSVRSLVTPIHAVQLPSSSAGPSLPSSFAELSESLDPDFALGEAARLRGSPGDTTALLRLLDRAGDGLMARFRYDEAAQVLQEALDLRRSLNLPAIELARAEIALAKALIEAGQYAIGLPHLQAAEELLGESASKIVPDELVAIDSLATLLLRVGRPQEAKELRERIVPIAEQVFGPQDPRTLTYMSNLALALLSLGDYSGSRVIEEQVVDLRKRLLGPEHPDTLTAMNNLSSALWHQNDLDGAQSLAEQVLEARRRLLGADHIETLIATNNLATILADRGDFAGAITLEQEVLAKLSKTVGSEHFYALTTRENIAMFRRNLGDLAAAQEQLEDVLKSKRRLFGSRHPSTVTSMERLAEMYEAQGRSAEANSLLEEAKAARQDAAKQAASVRTG